MKALSHEWSLSGGVEVQRPGPSKKSLPRLPSFDIFLSNFSPIAKTNRKGLARNVTEDRPSSLSVSAGSSTAPAAGILTSTSIAKNEKLTSDVQLSGSHPGERIPEPEPPCSDLSTATREVNIRPSLEHNVNDAADNSTLGIGICVLT